METPLLVQQGISNRALVGDALDLLFDELRPFVEGEMRRVYKERWLEEARGEVHGKAPGRWDVSDLLTIVYFKFAPVFRRRLGHEGRSWASLLKEVRKRWAHQADLSTEETRRTLETTILLLRAMDATEAAKELEPHVLELMQREIEARREAGDLPGTGSDGGGAPANLLGRGKRMLRRLSNRASQEPLVIRRDVLDEVERAALPYQRDFPFNRLEVHVLAPDAHTRLLYEAALGGQDEPFQHAVHRRLAEARIAGHAGIHVGWTYHRTPPEALEERFGDRAYCVELTRRTSGTSAVLTIVRGTTAEERYLIRDDEVVNVGRTVEVVDDRGRLVRHNRIAFVDYEDAALDDEQRAILGTVSRAHAHLRYDQGAAAFLLYDEQSTCGTSVVRQGYPIPIQVRHRPVALHDGDLLYFGKACLRFEYLTENEDQ